MWLVQLVGLDTDFSFSYTYLQDPLQLISFEIYITFVALKQLMLEKEAELALTNNELAELEEYQVLLPLESVIPCTKRL